MTRIHTIRQGECLLSLTHRYKFADLRKILDNPKNAALKEKTANPNVCHPGQKWFIPDIEIKEESGATENKHKFMRKLPKSVLRIAITDYEGRPITGKRYKLTIKDIVLKGDTGAGLIEEEIPTEAEDAQLTLWLDEENPAEGIVWILKIGYLDPVDQLTGVQARLNNLGFYCGPVSGRENPSTKAALEAFQKKYDLIVDGIAGQETKKKLAEIHGC